MFREIKNNAKFLLGDFINSHKKRKVKVKHIGQYRYDRSLNDYYIVQESIYFFGIEFWINACSTHFYWQYDAEYFATGIANGREIIWET